MDQIIFLPTVGLSLFLSLIYTWKCHSLKIQFDMAVLVNIVLGSSGIIGGTLLVASTIYPEFQQNLKSMNLYIFIAGLLVVAVSIQGLKKLVFVKAS